METGGKTAMQHMYTNFIVNRYASEHAQYKDQYSDKEKVFLEETYLKVLTLNLQTGKVEIWTEGQLYKHAEAEDCVNVLIHTPVADECWDEIAPTHWYDRLVLEQIVMSSVWEG